MRLLSLITILVSVLSLNAVAADPTAIESNTPVQPMPLAAPAPQPANSTPDAAPEKPSKKHHKGKKSHHAKKSAKKHHKKSK